MPRTKPPHPLARRILAGAGLLGLLTLVGLAGTRLLRGASSLASAPATVSPGMTQGSARPANRSASPRAGLSGQVSTLEGNPIAGAIVCAWGTSDRMLTTVQRAKPRCTSTTARGTYALTELLSATPLLLSASTPGFLPAGYRAPDGSDTLWLSEGEQRDQVHLVLRRGGVAIQGRVEDATGGVVPGAWVIAEGKQAAGKIFAMSDSKGEFTLWVEPGWLSLDASATGYAAAHAVGPAPGHFFALTLVPGATLVGWAVLAGTQTPVAGALLEAIQVEGGGARVSTRSDDHGHFTIEGLLPGRYRIEATAEGLEGYSRASITLGLGETSPNQVVELDRAYVVRGRVLDKVTRAPCTSGEVTITDFQQNEFSEASIQPDGWVRMASVIPGTYRVETRCRGFVHGTEKSYPLLTIRDRDLPPQTWEVERGASLRIAVVDPEGKPVTTASVSASPIAGGGQGGYASKAEPDGTFWVAGLEPAPYKVSVLPHDGGVVTREVTVGAEGETRITVELPQTGTIEGLVEDDGHHPVGGARVVLLDLGRTSTRSLEDGRFMLTGVPSGEHVLFVGESPWPTTDDKHPPVKVSVTAPDRTHVIVTVARRDARIEGQVVDSQGQPVKDAFIDHVQSTSEMSGMSRYVGTGRTSVLTDTDGHFTIESIEPGEYNLRAYRKGGGEGLLEHVRTGRHKILIKISEGAMMAGTLSSPKGLVDRFSIDVVDTRTSFRRYEMFFHAGGSFTIRDLPAGTYEVSAEVPEGAVHTEVTLSEGEQKKDLRLVLTMRGVVRGRIVDLESGAPVPGMQVTLDGTSRMSVVRNDSRDESTTGADGRFEVEGVLGGSWSLQMVPTGRDEPRSAYEAQRIPAEVKGGDVTDLGILKIVRRRFNPDHRLGDLGVFVQSGYAQESPLPLTVTSVSGAAEEAGLTLGDIIVTVDGFDVQGRQRYLYEPLTSVTPGRSVTLGLSRGNMVSVVAR